MSVRVESGQAALERAGGKSRHPLVLAARQLSTSSRTFVGQLFSVESGHMLTEFCAGFALFSAAKG